MQLNAETNARLGTALNEASLLAVEFGPDRRTLVVTLSVLALPAEGVAPVSPTIRVCLSPVGRIAASLRNGPWNDSDAEVTPFEVEQLDEVVRSFGGQPIYGWEFFDAHESDFVTWSDRLSLDWRGAVGDVGLAHTLSLFQEGNSRHLDLRIWFDRLEIRDAAVTVLDLDEFCAGGETFWRALFDGDTRATGHGIAPLQSRDDGLDVRGDEQQPDSPDVRDDPRWTRRDARLGALFLVIGLLVIGFAYLAMQNDAPIMLWGGGWMLGPLLLLLGGNAVWRSLRAER